MAGLQEQGMKKNTNEPEVMVEQTGGFYLTPEGFASLQQELEHLTVVKRPEIADRIRESLPKQHNLREMLARNLAVQAACLGATADARKLT